MTSEEQKKAIKEKLDDIKAIAKDGKMSINGREYSFKQCAHIQRQRVFGIYSKYQEQISRMDFSFLLNGDFIKAEHDIDKIVFYEGEPLEKLKQNVDYWDKHPEDYIEYIIKSMAVICIPFTSGMHGA